MIYQLEQARRVLDLRQCIDWFRWPQRCSPTSKRQTKAYNKAFKIAVDRLVGNLELVVIGNNLHIILLTSQSAYGPHGMPLEV